MKTMNILLAIFLTTVLSGFSRNDTKSGYDREVDFAKFKTFDWVSKPLYSEENPSAENTFLENRIKRAVQEKLTTLGYEKLTASNPDFLIDYHFEVSDKLYSTSDGYGNGENGASVNGYGSHGYSRYGFGRYGYGRYGYGRYGHGGFYGYSGSRPERLKTGEYRQVTLILDLVDPSSDQLIWRGIYVGAVKEWEISERKIRDAVNRIFRKFPNKQTKTTQNSWVWDRDNLIFRSRVNKNGR
jgi:hypothetical protein